MIKSWKELSVGKWMEIRDIQNDPAIDGQYTMTVAILSVLSDIAEDELYDMKINDFSKMTGDMAFLLEPMTAVPVCDKYKIGGYELVLVKDLKELTASQFIDYQNFVKESNRYFVELLSIFLIPKGKKYCKDYDIADVQRVIREYLSVADAEAIAAFFLLSFKLLYKSMQISLTRKLKKTKKRMKAEEVTQIEQAIANLEKSGVGYL